MKNATIQGVCCLALTLMTGAVAAHWQMVRKTMELASQLPRPQAVNSSAAPIAQEDPAVKAARQILAEAKAASTSATSRTEPISTASNAAQDARIERLISSCETLMAQNAELKNQVAETNRDLMALQFQVDSHSESFRPLKIPEESTARPAGTGVLPPREAP